MNEVEVKKNNVEKIKKEFERRIKKGLVKVGLLAEGDVSDRINANDTVDTGLMKNSITYALSGESPHKSSYHSDTGGKSGNYSGTLGSKDEKAVYIGTNVEYAPYIEYGHRYINGGYYPPHSFMKATINQYGDEYLEMIEEELKG